MLFLLRVLALIAIGAVFSGSVGAKADPSTSLSRIFAASDEAWVPDAREYAKRYSMSVEQALRHLRAQEESVVATDRLQQEFKDRFAGLSIEHHPYRIIVLLTGAEFVADRTIRAGGLDVPVVFRFGAPATRKQILRAMVEERSAIRAAFSRNHGVGFNGRTGELVVMMRGLNSESLDLAAALGEQLGVPLRLQRVKDASTNTAVEGGSRLVGVNTADGRRYVCTTGFVVTDGEQVGILTAAHCPDDISYVDPQKGPVPLKFVGGWGARYQDVQIHTGDAILPEPFYYADHGQRAVREVTGWRNRMSTRPGDFVCRRGVTSGYSCSEVELVDYAPPGELCGGPCDATWVTVAGPSCNGGDSGGPVFLGTVAFGVVKGGNYGPSGTCSLYYYMSTDYLPEGWTLLHRSSPLAARQVREQTSPSRP
jgi:hypothetical protein